MGNKKSGKQVHPQQSFQQLVAQATLQKFRPYIDSQIQGVAGALAQQQMRQLENIYLRLMVVENIVEEKLGINKDELAARVADIQDENDGFEKVEGALELGDRARIEIKTKTADQTEFQGSSRLQVENAGSGNTLGPELEGPLVGMKAGETKEIAFGKEKAMTASITLNKISRLPKQEESEAAEAPAQEAANDSNAGQ